jgi:PTS system N-acetylglucosamine-specific IIC component
MKTIQNFFIKLGKSLMLPIAVLPVAGILMRIGQPDVLNIAFIATAGSAVFDNLPIIFAIGVAVGFADDNHGAAALAGFVGHAIFISALKVLLPDVNMGVLSGILMGAVAGAFYNKYKAIQLPSYLAFFGGRRFVPIITGLTAIILAWLFGFFWGPVDKIITAGGNWIIGSGNIGLFSYGLLNRLLIPLGLHHILNSLIWFQFGDFTNAAGDVVHGDLWRFFAGDPTAGSFMAGFFPIMMFGLLGAALAMVLTANKDRRGAIWGIMISAGLTAFLTGITEPLEFSFMFLAFPLYCVHAVLTGLSMVIMNVLDVKLGFTFSAGLFDYVISFGLATHPLRLIPVGIAYFALYFVIFYFAIKKFNIKTPGREDDLPPQQVVDAVEEALEYPVGHELHIAAKYVEALGGIDNIVSIGNCTTRMRLEVKDNSKVDEAKIKALGARGLINKNGLAQVIIGTEVELITDKVKRVLDTLKNRIHDKIKK